MRKLTALTFYLLLLLPPVAASNETAPEGDQQPQLHQLLGELMQNVDMALMVRIQQTVMQNFDLIVPYSQEYFTCLKAEGDFDADQPMDLKNLMAQVKKTKDTCQVILESLFG
ncbi:MAG: hypothetical protein OQK12_09980, partial [Motiliproteus sp.]|nr:hypothetical protein [Motiliproteus sp.]